jgi:hypothetical protein
MTDKTPKPRTHNPKSDDGLSRSAEALRQNLLKRKAQKRAQAAQDIQTDPESGPEPDPK